MMDDLNYRKITASHKLIQAAAQESGRLCEEWVEEELHRRGLGLEGSPLQEVLGPEEARKSTRWVAPNEFQMQKAYANQLIPVCGILLEQGLHALPLPEDKGSLGPAEALARERWALLYPGQPMPLSRGQRRGPTEMQPPVDASRLQANAWCGAGDRLREVAAQMGLDLENTEPYRFPPGFLTLVRVMGPRLAAASAWEYNSIPQDTIGDWKKMLTRDPWVRFLGLVSLTDGRARSPEQRPFARAFVERFLEWDMLHARIVHHLVERWAGEHMAEAQERRNAAEKSQYGPTLDRLMHSRACDLKPSWYQRVDPGQYITARNDGSIVGDALYVKFATEAADITIPFAAIARLDPDYQVRTYLNALHRQMHYDLKQMLPLFPGLEPVRPTAPQAPAPQPELNRGGPFRRRPFHQSTRPFRMTVPT